MHWFHGGSHGGLHGAACLLVVACALLASGQALAISDEIQVNTDDINEPGERGLELHINTTPRGRRTPDYERDLPPYRSLRITPEFSWGLTKTLEAGQYVPMTTGGVEGGYHLGGVKARLKWLPLRSHAGWYLGGNVELSNVSKKFSESRVSTELRIMAGYRTDDCLLGVNPIFDWLLSPDYGGSPDFVAGLP